jgi:putative tryptophan/tyrosine transport system substrate-binding protein
MIRREFITLLGGAAAAWPFAAQAQREQVRRIGMLSSLAADDPQSQARNAALVAGMQERGWIVGRNLHIDFRWGEGDADRTRKYAAELVAFTPDVILAVGASIVKPLQQATRTVPLVFLQVTDPVGAGLVASLTRPGGNITGFTNFEFATSGKWVELLKQIAPRMTRAAVLRDLANPGSAGQFGAMLAAAPSFGIELRPLDLHDASDIERSVTDFAPSLNGGLIVLPGALPLVHRDLVVTLAARHRLPAVYPFRSFVTDGGLISYGSVEIDQYRQAAGYVDRILRGEKPANLPVQAPTKYETVINLKTAKALGLTVPDRLLALADEVIE